MTYLSPLDTSFLDLEDSDPHASLAIASLCVIDGPAPGQAEFADAIRERLPLVPKYRQRVVRVPFNLGHPVWVDEPHVDLDYHLRRTALPEPGDEATLCRLVARVMSQRLDRDRPLWEYWLVEGLPHGQWALLSKVHHCVVDGVSGNELYRLMLDTTPERRPPVADTWQPCREPGTLALLADAVGQMVSGGVDQARMLVDALHTPARLARRIGDTAQGLATLAGALIPTVPSSLIGPIGRSRRYAVVRAPLARLRDPAKALDATINDVVLAVLAGAVRAVMLARGEDPAPNAVRTLVPVNVRSEHETGIIDNRVSMMLPMLPVDQVDPVERVRIVHERVAALRASHEIEATASMTELARYEPFAPIAAGIRAALRLPQHIVAATITNVPGPRQQLYALGRPIREILPYVPIGNRMRLGVSVLTYGGQASFGITADFDTFPEVEFFAEAITAELAALARQTSDRRHAARRRAVRQTMPAAHAVPIVPAVPVVPVVPVVPAG